MTAPPPALGRAAAPASGARRLLRRVWDKGAADNIFFLAGGLAFAILLAGVPFFLLCAAGVGWLLKQSPELSTAELAAFLEHLAPAMEGSGSMLAPVLHDVQRTKAAAGVYGAVGFVWFSTRLFGTLRTVLDVALEVPKGRGIVKGKLFDLMLTLVSAVALAGYVTFSAYLAIAHGRGVAFLEAIGLRAAAMGAVQYWLGRAVGVALLFAIFYPSYRYLPHRRVTARQAVRASVVAVALFELARAGFGLLLHALNPGSLYTGTLAAVVVVVVWVYYAAMVFIFAGQVSQVLETAGTGGARA